MVGAGFAGAGWLSAGGLTPNKYHYTSPATAMAPSPILSPGTMIVDQPVDNKVDQQSL